MKEKIIFVKNRFSQTVNAGQNFCVSSRKGMNRNAKTFKGAGAKINMPNLGSH